MKRVIEITDERIVCEFILDSPDQTLTIDTAKNVFRNGVRFSTPLYGLPEELKRSYTEENPFN